MDVWSLVSALLRILTLELLQEVASVVQGNEDFAKALKDPLYIRIRQPLYSNGLSTGPPQPEDMEIDTSFLLEEQPERKDEAKSVQEMVNNHQFSVNSQEGDMFIQDISHSEIEEIKENDNEESRHFAELDDNSSFNMPTNQIDSGFYTNNKKPVIRPEVEQALRMLDDVISVFQECRSKEKTRTLPGNPDEDSQTLGNNEAKEAVSSKADQICRNVKAPAQPTEKKDPEMIALYEPRNSSGSHGSR